MHCTCSPAVYSALSKLGERPVLEGVGREASDSAEQSAAHASQEQKGLDRPASARLESLIRLPVMYEEEAQAVCEGAFASPSESLVRRLRFSTCPAASSLQLPSPSISLPGYLDCHQQPRRDNEQKQDDIHPCRLLLLTCCICILAILLQVQYRRR
ncbi:hypothetical protein TgHK011_005889 [Trichoderma gracile]|nr:hypothetical protein TgHK011_005889 [Trichoderma gracile]